MDEAKKLMESKALLLDEKKLICGGKKKNDRENNVRIILKLEKK